MAQSYTTDDGITLIDPGTYVSLKVANNTSGIATSGVITIIGESSAGPDYTQEENLDENAFGPDEISVVQQKYGSGRLVDAFRSVIAAANDPQIVGSVNLVKIVKTNPSTPSIADVLRTGFGQYSELTAKSQGAQGNLIQFGSAVSVPEVAPQTGAFSYVPNYTSGYSLGIRNNGANVHTAAGAALSTGPAFASSVESIPDGILAQGANQVNPLTALTGTNIACAPAGASTTTLIITLSGAFANVPAVGDTLVIPDASTFGATTASVLAGGSDENIGSYIVISVSPGVSTSTVTATRINAPGSTPVTTVVPTAISAGALDIITYKPINIRNVTGQNRNALPTASGTYTFTVTGSTVVMTPPSAWVAQPQVGDIVAIPSAMGSLNAGFYQVTASTATTATMTRLSNGSAGTSGTSSGATPFSVNRPVIDGTGKATEIAGNAAGIAFNSSTLSPMTFSNTMLTSSAEYENSFTVGNGNAFNTYISGGDIAISVACSQASATAVVGATGIAFKVGATTVFTALFAQFPTLSTLVSYINSQPTFFAVLSTTRLSNASPADLDKGTYGISATVVNTYPGRIKQDAAEWDANISGDPFVSPTQPASGLPEAISPNKFLTGGTLAGTTSSDFVSAIDACQTVTTNFIVPLVSQDASLDITEGQTDPTSTYAVDAVNAYTKTHVIFMSSLEERQNRIAVCSRNGSYTDQKQQAAVLSSFRVGLTFQDVKLVNGQGVIQEYQSWMAAIIAAGMQAAAGYKGIVKKFANISGIVKPEGDFNAALVSARKDALQAGLLILEKVTTGGFRWVSDQMTYSADNNFVYNSMQAVYLADLMALTLISQFDMAVVGKSIAQVSAAGALSFLDGQMFNFRRLNWIAPSDDAPKGYKNASVRLLGGVMLISVEVKLAGLIYFVPITFTVSQVQQSASQ